MSTLRLTGSTSGYTEVTAPAVAGSNTLVLPGGNGTADQALVTNGSGTLSFADRGRMVLETAKASTSGTSIDFTGIPSWVKRVTVSFQGVSTNGTSAVRLRIGPVGGVETSSYVGVSTAFATTSLSTNVFTAGIDVADGSVAASTRNGQVVFTLIDAASNHWAFSGNIAQGDSSRAAILAGSKSLAGTLSVVCITTVNGTDTFDAGSINLLLEG